MRKQVTNGDLLLLKLIDISHMMKQITHCDLASQNQLIQKSCPKKLVTWIMEFVFICQNLGI